jgi:hypothetical protein
VATKSGLTSTKVVKQVLEMLEDGQVVHVHSSVEAAAKAFQVSFSNMCNIISTSKILHGRYFVMGQEHALEEEERGIEAAKKRRNNQQQLKLQTPFHIKGNKIT